MAAIGAGFLMATTVVPIVNVQVEVNPVAPSLIVGAEPWDADPATYTQTATSDRAGISYITDAQGELQFPAGVTVTGASLEIDLWADDVGAASSFIMVGVELWDATRTTRFGAFSSPGWEWAEQVQVPSLGAVHTISDATVPLSAVLSAAANPGSTLVVTRYKNGPYSPPSDYYVRCHRVVLTIEHAGEPPVTRQYPRDDGRGLSSAARIYPPTKARRIVGGYQ